jgi:HKD family nuclease
MGRAARIGTVTNTGLNTLARFLDAQGKGCERIDIAVAFVTAAGLDQVLHLLKRVAAKGEVRILTGFYQGFTEPKALRTLLREQRNTAGRLSVKVSNDPHFHWKAYLLVKKATARVVVGSSNLTADGLNQTGELNLALSVGTSSKAFRDVSRVFNDHWTGKSAPLTASVVGKYETWREAAGGSPRHRKVPIKKLISGAAKAEKPQPTEVRYWRVGLTGYFSDETEAILTLRPFSRGLRTGTGGGTGTSAPASRPSEPATALYSSTRPSTSSNSSRSRTRRRRPPAPRTGGTPPLTVGCRAWPGGSSSRIGGGR